MPRPRNEHLPNEGFTPEFLRALTLIGEAMEDVATAGHARPVLVGGAALELWTTGRYVTGDFDLVSPDPGPMETALLRRGFQREDRAGHLLRGLYHPDLGFGIEFVSGRLFDGLADPTRLRLVDVAGASRVQVIPIEDVIADRLGQFVANRRGARESLDQARLAFAFAMEMDRAYLDKRIRQETAQEMGLADLERLIGDGND